MGKTDSLLGELVPDRLPVSRSGPAVGEVTLGGKPEGLSSSLFRKSSSGKPWRPQLSAALLWSAWHLPGSGAARLLTTPPTPPPLPGHPVAEGGAGQWGGQSQTRKEELRTSWVWGSLGGWLEKGQWPSGASDPRGQDGVLGCAFICGPPRCPLVGVLSRHLGSQCPALIPLFSIVSAFPTLLFGF